MSAAPRRRLRRQTSLHPQARRRICGQTRRRFRGSSEAQLTPPSPQVALTASQEATLARAQSGDFAKREGGLRQAARCQAGRWLQRRSREARQMQTGGFGFAKFDKPKFVKPSKHRDLGSDKTESFRTQAVLWRPSLFQGARRRSRLCQETGRIRRLIASSRGDQASPAALPHAAAEISSPAPAAERFQTSKRRFQAP